MGSGGIFLGLRILGFIGEGPKRDCKDLNSESDADRPSAAVYNRNGPVKRLASFLF